MTPLLCPRKQEALPIQCMRMTQKDCMALFQLISSSSFTPPPPCGIKVMPVPDHPHWLSSEATHSAHSNCCESLKWPTEKFLFIIFQPDPLFFSSERTSHSLFHYQTHATVGVIVTGPNNCLCSELGEVGSREASPSPSSMALAACGSKDICFMPQSMPSSPASLQYKLHTPPDWGSLVCQGGFTHSFYF